MMTSYFFKADCLNKLNGIRKIIKDRHTLEVRVVYLYYIEILLFSLEIVFVTYIIANFIWYGSITI